MFYLHLQVCWVPKESPLGTGRTHWWGSFRFLENVLTLGQTRGGRSRVDLGSSSWICAINVLSHSHTYTQTKVNKTYRIEFFFCKYSSEIECHCAQWHAHLFKLTEMFESKTYSTFHLFLKVFWIIKNLRIFKMFLRVVFFACFCTVFLRSHSHKSSFYFLPFAVYIFSHTINAS